MISVFVDSSVLFAAVYSSRGIARDLVNLAITQQVQLVITPFALEEVRRNIALDFPEKLSLYEAVVMNIPFRMISNPTHEQIVMAAQYTVIKDAPIIAAAINAQVDYLVTYDREQLLDRPEVAEKSGLRIVTPDVVIAAL